MKSSPERIREIAVIVGCLYRKTEVKTLQQSSYEFLLAKRRDPFLEELDNRWELPGGTLERGESDTQCLKREFLEETGYYVNPKAQLERAYTYVRKYPDVTQYTTVTCYRCELASDDRLPTKPDQKIEEVRWFHPEDIDYRLMLQGSKEFLVDVASDLGVRIEAEQEKNTYLCVFEVIDPNEKRFGRWYSMTVQYFTQTNEYALVNQYAGRIGRGVQKKRVVFPDFREMSDKAKEIIKRRHKHGYSVVKWDDDFPLLKWMKEQKIVFSRKETDIGKTEPIQFAMLFEEPRPCNNDFIPDTKE